MAKVRKGITFKVTHRYLRGLFGEDVHAKRIFFVGERHARERPREYGSRAMTLDQQEPSANSPCTKTTFFVFSDVWALATRSSTGRAALAATAPISVRRFIIVSY
jgi:hypothetical protein